MRDLLSYPCKTDLQWEGSALNTPLPLSTVLSFEKQKVWGDVQRRDLTIHKMGWKEPTSLHVHQKSLQNSVVGKDLIPFLRNQHNQVPPKGEQGGGIKKSIGNSISGVKEMLWDSSQAWNAAVDGHSLFRKDKTRQRGQGVVLYVRPQWEPPGVNNEPAESLQVSISRPTNAGDAVVGVQHRSAQKVCKEGAPCCQVLVFMGDSNHSLTQNSIYWRDKIQQRGL